MKHLLILAILAVFLTLALVGTEVVGQGSPVSSISPVPSPTVSWILPPTRVPSNDPVYNQCVDEILRDYPQAGLIWAEAYCIGDAPHPRKYWPTPTPEYIDLPYRPVLESTPIVLGEFYGTWWKNEVTECNLYTDGYRIVRIGCDE